MFSTTAQTGSHKKATNASASQLQPIKFPFKTERGITSYLRPDRPKPYYFREFIQGKSVVSAFRTKEEIVDYARERMRLRLNQDLERIANFFGIGELFSARLKILKRLYPLEELSSDKRWGFFVF